MSRFEGHLLHPQGGVPLFIAPGPIKEEGQLRPFLSIEDPLASPVVFAGGFTLNPEIGNAARNGGEDFVYDPATGAAGNARGLPNYGKEGLLALAPVIKELGERGVRVVIQVTNLPHEDPLDVIPEMVEAAASINPTAVEVNLSCPNGLKPDGSFHLPICNDASVSAEVMHASREAAGPEVCLGAKDSSHVTSLDGPMDLDAIGGLAQGIAPYIDFITGINTIGGQEFPGITAAGGKGGMSGPIVAPVARKHLVAWQEVAPDIPYLSCGGVDSANASFEIPLRRQLGAMLVGGAQEFYRAPQPHLLAARWAQAYAASA